MCVEIFKLISLLLWKMDFTGVDILIGWQFVQALILTVLAPNWMKSHESHRRWIEVCTVDLIADNCIITAAVMSVLKEIHSCRALCCTQKLLLFVCMWIADRINMARECKVREVFSGNNFTVVWSATNFIACSYCPQ